MSKKKARLVKTKNPQVGEFWRVRSCDCEVLQIIFVDPHLKKKRYLGVYIDLDGDACSEWVGLDQLVSKAEDYFTWSGWASKPHADGAVPELYASKIAGSVGQGAAGDHRMSKWIWVTHDDGSRSCINTDSIHEFYLEPELKSIRLWCDTDPRSSYLVKETPEELYAAIHGLPLAYLDHIKGAIVVEAHEQELYVPVPRTKAIGDADITWAAFALKQLRDGITPNTKTYVGSQHHD